MAGLDTVEVCIDLVRFGHPVLMGQLHRQQSGSGEIFSFEYDRDWLEQPEVFSFDPDLALAAGHQYPAPQRKNFGIFLDSAPDRWGRVLMQRRENARARQEKRKPRALTAWDFLLGVHDETRLGALRFRESSNTPFIDSDAQFAAPPLISLRELQAASLQFEKHIDDEDNPLYEKWLTQLFAPGSSLGGARPKASVRDEAGILCMAKFPSRNDTRDMGGWELVAHSLARKAGIIVPDAIPLRFPESPYTTFLVKRFDRTTRGGRLAFISAMTLTLSILMANLEQAISSLLTYCSRAVPTHARTAFNCFDVCSSTSLFATRTITFATTGFLSTKVVSGCRPLTTSIRRLIDRN